jgi:hypothetical protein
MKAAVFYLKTAAFFILTQAAGYQTLKEFARE